MMAGQGSRPARCFPFDRLRISMTVVALLLVACGQAAPSGSQPEEQVAAKPATGVQCEVGKEIWRSPGPPKRGGTIIRAADASDHLDIPKGGRSGLGSMPQVYQGILQLRGCFASDTAVAPGLAQSWEVSADGRTWTLKLQPGAKWHNRPPLNGRPFTASDAVWMIEHQKREGGLAAYWDGVTPEARDASTLVLRTPEPDADLLPKMAFPQNVMMPKEIKEQNGDFRTLAVGTGAWMVKEFKPNQEMVLEPNPDYWEMGEDGKRLPYLDEVRGPMFSDYAAELAAMRAGRIDTNTLSGLRKLDADQMKQTFPKYRAWELVQFPYQALWINLSRKPFDDVRVRKAAQLALDREDTIAANRGAVAHSGFVPPFLVDYAWPEEKVREKFKADPAAAKKLLAEAGFASGTPEFEMHTSTVFAEDAELVQKQLDAVGIRSKITAIPGTFTPIHTRRDWDMAWGAPGGVLFVGGWIGDLVRTGSSRNAMQFSDPQIDRLADAQARELDPAKRKVIVDQIQDLLYEKMPWVPGMPKVFFHFISCRVKNYMMIQPAYNGQSILYGWIDQAGC